MMRKNDYTTEHGDFLLDLESVRKIGLEKAFLLQWISGMKCETSWKELDLAELERETTLSKFKIQKYIGDFRELGFLIVEYRENGKIIGRLDDQNICDYFG